MNFVSNERITANLLIIDAKNYEKWCKLMKVSFDYQDVPEVIKNGMNPLVEGAQRATHKEKKKKYFLALFLIH